MKPRRSRVPKGLHRCLRRRHANQLVALEYQDAGDYVRVRVSSLFGGSAVYDERPVLVANPRGHLVQTEEVDELGRIVWRYVA